MKNLELARRFIEAIDAADVETMRALYAPDARIWHDFDGVEQTVEQNIELLMRLRAAVPSSHWQMQRLEPLGDGFVLTYRLCATVKDAALELPACVIGTVADGRISRIEEWINTQPLLSRLSPEALRALASPTAKSDVD